MVNRKKANNNKKYLKEKESSIDINNQRKV